MEGKYTNVVVVEGKQLKCGVLSKSKAFIDLKITKK